MGLFKYIMDIAVNMGCKRLFYMLTMIVAASLLASPFLLCFQETGSAELSNTDLAFNGLVDLHEHHLDELTHPAAQSMNISFLAFPLYSKVSTNIFLNETRADIHQLISKDQGITFGAITRELDLANGAAQHHIRILEREGYVKSIRVGKYTRYYLTGHDGSDITELQEKILTEVIGTEGMSQSDIASSLDTSRQVINYNIKHMVENGLIKEVHIDNRCVYYINK